MSYYYTAPDTPLVRGRLSSEEIRDQWAALELAFSLMPLPVGGGNLGFTSGQWVSPTITNADITGSAIGSVASPCLGYFSRLYPVASSTTNVGVGLRAWVANSAGDLKLLKEATAHLVIDTNGNIVVGDGVNELVTSTSTGFLYIPSVNGIPTGTPTSYSAAVPFVYNRAADKIGVFNGTWKFTAALT